MKVRKGHANRKRDLEAVKADEGSQQVDARILSVNKALAQLAAPPRKFAEVTAWENSFLDVNWRWKILVLCADTSSGKSNFAETLFEAPYVLTVEGSQHLDLREFNYDANDGIVLDNVNTWQQILNWRAVLQARNAKSKGGQSATNVLAYPQYLYGVPVVATIDLDAPDAHLADEASERRSKWLCHNCTILRLPVGECFYEKALVPKLKIPNTFSRFAQTVKRRRKAAQEQDPSAARA